MRRMSISLARLWPDELPSHVVRDERAPHVAVAKLADGRATLAVNGDRNTIPDELRLLTFENIETAGHIAQLFLFFADAAIRAAAVVPDLPDDASRESI